MQENYEAKAIASPAEVKRVELRDMETDVEQCFIESGDDHLKVLSSPDSLSSSFLNSHVNSPLNNPVKESQIPRRQLMPKSWRRDFTTIDFLLETHHNRIEAMKFRGENSKRKYIGWFLNFQYSLQAWIVLILVGIATAMNTAFIHYAADWLSGFKFGVCSHGFFIEKSKCCLDQVNGM